MLHSYYAMVINKPLPIAFGMCHVICFLFMWYAFSKPKKTSIYI